MSLLKIIHSFDIYTFDRCLKNKHRDILIVICLWISRSADGYLYAVAAFFLGLNKEWGILQVMALAFILERAIYFVTKNKLKRNRPQQTIAGFQSVIQPSDQFSFPSGHTSAAFLMFGIFSAFIRTLALPLLIWAIWVGISRVVLGVHFPTDSVAGAVLGYSMSQCCLSLLI